MLYKQSSRPQTSIVRNQNTKYRNQSHIQFGQANSNQLYSENKELIKKRRPASYRNISKIGQFMNDTIIPAKEKQQVHYINSIQNSNKFYQVPKNEGSYIKKDREFEQFFQKNGNKFYKHVDQFCEYSDLVQKNSILLRRGQFNLPLGKQQFSTLKATNNSQASTLYNRSKYFTKYNKYYTTKHNLKLCNTISSTLKQSNKQKRNIEKQKLQFHYSTLKYSQPVNKTFLGHADQYQRLLSKQRYHTDKVSLNNSMSRVLTMQVMGKQIQNLTHMYT